MRFARLCIDTGFSSDTPWTGYVDARYIKIRPSSVQPIVLPADQSLSPNECPVCSSDEQTNHIGGPINTHSGNYGYEVSDINIATRGQPLRFDRSYHSLTTLTNTVIYSRPLGYGWTHNYDINLTFAVDPGGEAGKVILKAPHGSRLRFGQFGNNYKAEPGVRAKLVGSDGVYTMTAVNQEQFVFNSLGNLTSRIDPQGNTLTFSRTNGITLTRVTDASTQRYLDFGYDGQGRLQTVTDSASREIRYGYDANDNLITVNDARGFTWTYVYSGNTHLLHEIKDPTGKVLERTFYQGFGGSDIRATLQQNGANDTVAQIEYLPNGQRRISEEGRVITDTYNSQNLLVSQTDNLGRVMSYTLDGNFNRTQANDVRGNSTNYVRDQNGLTHKIMDALNHPTDFEYDTLNNLTVITDANSTVTTFAYNDAANSSRVTAINTVSGTTRYSYNGYGQIISTTNRRGHTTQYGYDTVGNLTVITDAQSNPTRFAYDILGRVITVTNARNALTVYQYDNADNIQFETRNWQAGACNPTECNLTTEYQYDNAGRLTHLIPPDTDQTVFYEYDAAGRVVKVIRSYQDGTYSNSQPDRDLVTRFEYDAFGRPRSRFERLSASQERETRLAYDALGRIEFVIFNYISGSSAPDANLSTSYTYSDNGNRAIVDITDPSGITTRYEYDQLNRLDTVIVNIGCSGDDCNLTTSYDYDNVGNLTLLTDPLNIDTQYSYDPLHRLTNVIENYTGGSSTTDENVTTGFQYDPEGNLTQVKINNQVIAVNQYDALNQLNEMENALSHQWVYSYDDVGNLEQLTDPISNITSYQYDKLNRLTLLDYPEYDVTFGYDKLSNRIAMTDTTGTTSYTYDAANRLKNVTAPGQASPVSYQYDAVGNRTKLTYPDGKVIDYAYDDADRLKTLTPNWDSGSYVYTYTNQRLAQFSRPNGQTTNYGYDEAGRLNQISHWANNDVLAAFSYILDEVGNIVQVTESLLPPPIYLPIIFKNSTGSQSQQQQTILIPEPPTEATATPDTIFSSPLPTPTPNPTATPVPVITLDQLRVELDNAFNIGDLTDTLYKELQKNLDKAADAISKAKPDKASQELQVFSFTLLAARGTDATPATADLLIGLAQQLISQWQSQASIGRVAGLASPIFTPAGPTQDGGTLALLPMVQSSFVTTTHRVITYTYDDLYRLTDAIYSTGESFEYTYDARGNRLSQTTLTGTTVYTYDTANRLIEMDGQALTWNANGNLLNDGTRAYGYDTANRLISMTNGTDTTTFVYNGDGDRVEQAVNSLTTEYVLDPVGLAQVLQETTNGQITFFVPGLGQYDANGWEYFATDRLGSVRTLVGPDGAPMLTQSFDPFGNVLERSGAGSSVFGYTGEQTDATDLVYLRARYYAPYLNQFLTPDPAMPDYFNPQSMNRYSYAYNNPINMTDPTGLTPDCTSLGCRLELLSREVQGGQGFLSRWHHLAIVFSDESGTPQMLESFPSGDNFGDPGTITTVATNPNSQRQLDQLKYHLG